MPDLRQIERNRSKVQLDELAEHGQVKSDERLPVTWRKVWVRFDDNSRTVTETDTRQGIYVGERQEVDFLVRFSNLFQTEDWIRYRGRYFRIESTEDVDRHRWLTLRCKSTKARP